MRIGGFQPLSLIDYPAKPCSIIFTQGCVFRCSYCHNPNLIPLESKHLRDSSAMLDFLTKRKKIVTAVCITGGEPTIQGDLIDFIKQLKERGFFIKIDTNGIRPGVVADLIDEELVDYIAMDIKAPWEKYKDVVVTAVPELVEACKESFRIIQQSSIEHEFRTTIYPSVHTEGDFYTMAGYLKPGEQYFIQKTRFDSILDPSISQESEYDGEEIALRLQARYASLHITLR